VDGDVRWLDWLDAGLFRARAGSVDVDVWPRPDVPWSEVLERFDREVTAVFLQASGAQAMHASSVLGPAGAIAICGASGSGKSTSAYACARAGYRQLGDDQFVFEFEHGRPVARTLAFTPGLRPATRAHFSVLDEERAIDQTAPDERVPFARIVLLEQRAHVPDGLDVRPVAASDAFTALLPHAHCFDLGSEAEVARLVSDYSRLVESVPARSIAYEPCFSVLPRLIRALVD
jgi:hypothetical protein